MLFSTDNMSALLPDEIRTKVSGMQLRRRFDLSYRLDCQHLFSDFKENVDFQFSLGLTSLMNRFLGPKGSAAAMLGFASVVSHVYYYSIFVNIFHLICARVCKERTTACNNGATLARFLRVYAIIGAH